MLNGALIALALAVLPGSWLAVLHFDGRGPEKTPWAIAALHATLALGGFAALLIALSGPAAARSDGTGAFGIAAAGCLALAALAGSGIFLKFRRGRKPAGGLVGLHATLAIFGLVILAAFVMAG